MFLMYLGLVSLVMDLKQHQTSEHDLIVIGASAGGVEALIYLVQQLPTELNAAVVIVLHISHQSPHVLGHILNKRGNLPVSLAQDGEVIEKGKIYVAPPDYHLLVKSGYLHLTKGSQENHHRPAINPLFRTAARTYGPRVVAVLLTGMQDDGTVGMMAVKMRGGVAVVQDPDDAMCSAMPRSAIKNIKEIDHILPLTEIPSVLVGLVNTAIATTPAKPVPKQIQLESEVLEEALWCAMQALQEKAMLAERMAARMRSRNLMLAAQRMEQEAADAHQRSTVIRDVLAMTVDNTQPLC